MTRSGTVVVRIALLLMMFMAERFARNHDVGMLLLTLRSPPLELETNLRALDWVCEPSSMLYFYFLKWRSRDGVRVVAGGKEVKYLVEIDIIN
jgi:hypothetical protein